MDVEKTCFYCYSTCGTRCSTTFAHQGPSSHTLESHSKSAFPGVNSSISLKMFTFAGRMCARRRSSQRAKDRNNAKGVSHLITRNGLSDHRASDRSVQGWNSWSRLAKHRDNSRSTPRYYRTFKIYGRRSRGSSR